MTIRHKLLGTVAAVAIAVGISGHALAADLIMKAPPRPVAAPTWTGFYVGADAGYGWSKFKGDVWSQNCEDCFTLHSLSTNPNGMLLGLHAGYNVQSGQWVWGIEGDITSTPGWKKNRNQSASDPFDDTGLHGEVHGLASLRLRLGWAVDRTLFYVTGGVGFASKTSMSSTSQHHFVPVTDAKIRTGGVVGGGIEWKYNPNLSLRVEGLYYIFNEKQSLTNLSEATGGDQTGCPGNNICTHGIRDVATIKFGVSWHPQPW